MKLFVSQPLTIAITLCAMIVCAAIASTLSTREPTLPVAAYYYKDIAPSDGAKDLAFDNIEDALRNFEYDPEQPDEYGPGLESTLRQASEEFSQPISQAQLERINFLASKLLPAEAMEIFSTSFPLFINYHLAEKEFLNNEPRPDNIQGELAQFDKLSALRLQYLGESLNHLLYYKQNLFTHNLLSRRVVQSDDSLSEEEKQRKLKELQEALQKEMNP